MIRFILIVFFVISFLILFSSGAALPDASDVLVENVHLNDSLMTLCYNITNSEDIE